MWKLAAAGVIFAGAVISYAAITDGDSDSGKTTVAQQGSLDDEALDEENDWANAYCPNALPLLKVEDNPYLPLQAKYNEEGNNRKEFWASQKKEQYASCADNSHHLATAALLANEGHQTMLESGTPMQIHQTSKESALGPMLRGSGKYFQHMAQKSYDLAYAKPSNRLTPSDRDAIMRKTFCECLTQPTESYLKND